MHRCVRPARGRRGLRSLLCEVGLLGVLYAGYTVARLFADDDLATTRGHAHDLVALESAVGLDVERAANAALSAIPLLEVAAAYSYASLHYVVTPIVLVLLWRRAPEAYPRWRWVLMLLAGSLLRPWRTGPIRLEPRREPHVSAADLGISRQKRAAHRGPGVRA